jgi:preprotein translocase subunit SecD
MKMNRDGARKFEVLTGNNINRRLAIVLDGVIYAAPMIKDRIPRGEAQISGTFTLDEVRDLVIVLRTGNLKAPVKEARTVVVGASLGADSIRSGAMAGIVGFLAVVLFMLIYYKGAGFIADFALVCNIAFIGAMLAAFGATLTLPGIAGIILTIGMAVDSNVLIYERIKEELDNGKTARSAVDAGYNRATITIWDSQLTTLIAAAVLYNIGSGPVRGFAVTLAIGIVGSMFTAIVLVRAIFDAFILRKNKPTLSI